MRLLAAAALGLAAGKRSMSPLAAVSWMEYLGLLSLKATPFAWLGSDEARKLLTALAAGEIVADKLPILPDRRVPWSFAGRIASGAISGAAVAQDTRGLSPEALTAGLGAIAGTFAGAILRRLLKRAFGSDLPGAAIEDMLMILLVLGAAVALDKEAKSLLETAIPSPS